MFIVALGHGHGSRVFWPVVGPDVSVSPLPTNSRRRTPIQGFFLPLWTLQITSCDLRELDSASLSTLTFHKGWEPHLLTPEQKGLELP